MKFIIAFCLFGVAMAVPQQRPGGGRQNPITFPSDGRVVNVLRSEISPIFGAAFKYLYETDNGIFAEKEGREGSQGQSNMVGTYRFQTPEGETVEVRYVADENGYQPESAHIPVAPPLPPHALEQIRIAEQQRAAGVRWDERGFQI